MTLPIVYDPRESGARCEDCPLQGRTVVPPELRPGRVLYVGAEPDIDSENEGKPFVGASWRVLKKLLQKVGLERSEVSLTTARLCRRKKTDPKAFDKQSLKCCRPRLSAEVASSGGVVALGKEAMSSVYGDAEGSGDDAITKLRGFPLATPSGKKLLVTFPPKMLLAEPRWIEVVEGDLAKAQRHFRGALRWQDPKMFLDPTPDQLDAALSWFSSRGDLVVTDTETGDGQDAFYPGRAKLRCVGLGAPDLVVVARFNSVPRQGEYVYKTPPYVAREKIANFFATHKYLAGHNVNVYDRPILERHGMPLPDKVADTLIAGHVADSEFPHDLGFESSRYTDSPRHKPTHDHESWESDSQLDWYCLMHGTPIVMPDGSTRLIQELVRERYNGNVWSQAADGSMVQRRVIGWHQNRVAGQKWRRIKSAADRERSHGLRLTPEHVVYLHRGQVRADAVTVGDEIAIPERAFSAEQRSAVLGTLLGDSSLAVSPVFRKDPSQAVTMQLVGGHATVSGLTQSKVAELAGFAEIGEEAAGHTVSIAGRVGEAGSFLPWRINSLHQLRLFGSLIGFNKPRTISRELLDALGPVGLAWWFMDDGCLQKEAKAQRDSVVIATHRYARNSIELAQAWFNEKFGTTYVCADGALRLGWRAAKAFALHIAPHVFPKQRYKLPRQLTDLPPWRSLQQASGEPFYARVIESREYESDRSTAGKRHLAEMRYCLTVEGEHNFFAGSGLVANCGMDCVTNSRFAPVLFSKMMAQLPPGWKGPHPVYQSDSILQKLCVDMHASGMAIDLVERERHSVRLLLAMAKAQVRANEVVGRPINMSSPDQVRDFLYGELGLPWGRETDSGEPSTDKDAIYELLMQSLPERAVQFIDALLDHRRAAKMKEGYVDTAVPYPLTGRVHPFWACHTVVSGRLNARNPAVQTIPDKKHDLDSMRSMYVAGPGNVLVAADKEQQEFRLVTQIADDKLWKDAILSGKDIHKLNANAFLGVDYDKVASFERDFSKTLIYMYFYGGGAKVAAGNMRKVRDPKTGARKFPRFTEEEAEVMRARILSMHPALPAWWERVGKMWWASSPDPLTRAIRTRILGRVRHFKNSSTARPGWEDLKEMTNHEIQGTAADMMGGSGSSGKLMERIPRGLYGPGIIHHGHDSLTTEVGLQHMSKAAVALHESMTDYFEDMPMPCNIYVGRRWSTLVKIPPGCDMSQASLLALLATEKPSISQQMRLA